MADRVSIQVRELSGLAEYAGAVDLQRQIWGWHDVDLIPVRFFVVAKSIGGQVLGAFSGQSMIGFCLAVPAIVPNGEVYLHSHMLGVLPECRNSGAGWRLKIAQREDAIARGFRLIEWTFDPLELKNAYFNLVKLGAIVRKYLPNQYGVTTSALALGLPTDRCVAEWHIADDFSGLREQRNVVAQVALPAEIGEIKRYEPDRARDIQRGLCEQFQKHFAAGLAVTGFERTGTSGIYLFSPDPRRASS